MKRSAAWSDESERDTRLSAILNTTVDGIVTINHLGEIESFNLAAEKLFGYSAAEVIGRNVRMLMPDPYSGEHDRYLSNYLTTGIAKIIGIGREVTGLRKDGSTFPMDLAVSEVTLGTRRLFTGIVHDITERHRLERQIVEISSSEQRRIGQDLHDGLCQYLAGISFACATLEHKLEARHVPEAAAIAEIAELVDQAITQARDVARGLQPVTDRADGLLLALRVLAQNVAHRFEMICRLICDPPVLVHDNAMATHLYRIAQEAISNAIKHGRARRVTITLALRGKELILSIKDDGVGIGHPIVRDGGMGLQTMSYRARVIRGRLRVGPASPRGTLIVCTVPNTQALAELDTTYGTKTAQANKQARRNSRAASGAPRGAKRPATRSTADSPARPKKGAGRR